ncbi:MAG: cupin domain-containing protein [Solirubrobacteraceae bacterium]
MTTLASPSLNGSPLAVWRVEMAPGASGPQHEAGLEQVLVVTDGELAVTVDGARHDLRSGDALRLPAAAPRQVVNEGPLPATAVVSSFPGATATVPGQDPVPIPWAA